MAEPSRPQNPRVVYPDASPIPIRALSYEDTIKGTHYWVSLDPAFVPWAPGVHTTYDTGDGWERHEIIVGFDCQGGELATKEVSNMEPTNLTREQLSDVLRDMAGHVIHGDSYEGNVAYTFSQSDPNCFSVQGVYRTGNRFGQGSVRMIGDVRDPGVETVILYDRDGTPVKSVTLALVRPRMDVIAWAGHLFVWNKDHEHYREATCYDVAET
jgi:hypothetical protein